MDSPWVGLGWHLNLLLNKVPAVAYKRKKTLIRRKLAFHFQKPEASRPLTSRTAALVAPHFHSNNWIKEPHGQKLPAQSLAPPSWVVLRKLLGLSGPFSSFRKWKPRNLTASPRGLRSEADLCEEPTPERGA